MKDTHEANLPTEENGKLEETKAPETTPENTAEKHLKQKSKQTKLRQVKKPLRLRENCRKKKFWRN